MGRMDAHKKRARNSASWSVQRYLRTIRIGTSAKSNRMKQDTALVDYKA